MRFFAALCLLLSVPFCLPAQHYSIYQNIGTGNGLPSNYVFGVAEDENGFLWAGTDKGLCAYDGFRWQVWDKDNGLPGNYVNTVLSDKHGGLWLGISEKGFFHFDAATGRVRPLRTEGRVLPYSLQADADGNLYAEMVSGAYLTGCLFQRGSITKPEVLFHWQSDPRVHLKADAAKKEVYCLYEDRNEAERVQRLLKSKWPLRERRLSDAGIFSDPVYYVSDSVVVTNSAYYRFAQDGRLLQHVPLFTASNNYAFACPSRNGLYVYNVKTGYYFFNRQNRPAFFDNTSGLGTNYVNHIYETKDGTVVFSTLGAGLQLIKNQYRKTFYTGNRTVRTILSQGNRWQLLAGDRIYQTTDTSTTLMDLGPSGSSALHLFKKRDTLMVGTLQGIHLFSEGHNFLRPAGFLEYNAGVSSILYTDSGYLAGTFGGGLMRFRGEAIRQRLPDYPLRIVEKLVPLSFGFAALSYEDGLLLTNAATGKHRKLTQQQGLLSNSVYAVFEKGRLLYIGTKGGLSVYDGEKVVATFRFRNGAQEKVLACFEDTNKQLWVVSNRSLHRVTGNALTPIASFPVIGDDDVVTTAAYNPATNEVGIGSNKSFSIVSLGAILPNAFVATPRLLQTAVDGQAVTGTDLSVAYNFQRLRFTVAPLSSLPFTQTRFYYQLSGFADDWREVKDSLTVSFSGLRPGKYVLRFKSLNADGYESAPLRLAVFTVAKPFWQRWPFLVLCVAVVAGATALVMQQWEKAKRRKKEAAFLLQQTLQAERERIARDLHDHLGANLATIIAQTDNIESRLYKGDLAHASHTVQNLSAQSRETLNVLRETIWAVQEKEHSLQDFVLRIRTFLQRLFDGTTVEWEVSNRCDDAVVLSPTQTLHLFRILQEASQNIVKHAGATKAGYGFSCEAGTLTITVQDNGSGFALASPSTNGLVNMRERARLLRGSFFIKSEPSVSITVSVPL